METKLAVREDYVAEPAVLAAFITYGSGDFGLIYAQGDACRRDDVGLEGIDFEGVLEEQDEPFLGGLRDGEGALVRGSVNVGIIQGHDCIAFFSGVVVLGGEADGVLFHREVRDPVGISRNLENLCGKVGGEGHAAGTLPGNEFGFCGREGNFR